MLLLNLSVFIPSKFDTYYCGTHPNAHCDLSKLPAFHFFLSRPPYHSLSLAPFTTIKIFSVIEEN